jgi:hypothetical protein
MRPAAAPAVLALVAAAAACGGGGGDDELPAVEGPVSPRVEIHATEMAYSPDAMAVEAGPVDGEMTGILEVR